MNTRPTIGGGSAGSEAQQRGRGGVAKMPPTIEQRLDALEHVLYEMEMFVNLPIRCDERLLGSALTESYWIHTRVLCDFFQQARCKDDVVCGDYGFERKPLGVADEIELRFDKSLAHLTYSRLTFKEDAQKWIINKFRPQLLHRIREFLQHIVANPRLGHAKEIKKARSLLASLPEAQRGPKILIMLPARFSSAQAARAL
jgi:hypothetical protein